MDGKSPQRLRRSRFPGEETLSVESSVFSCTSTQCTCPPEIIIIREVLILTLSIFTTMYLCTRNHQYWIRRISSWRTGVGLEIRRKYVKVAIWWNHAKHSLKRAISIDNVKINTSLILMREWWILMENISREQIFVCLPHILTFYQLQQLWRSFCVLWSVLSIFPKGIIAFSCTNTGKLQLKD